MNFPSLNSMYRCTESTNSCLREVESSAPFHLITSYSYMCIYKMKKSKKSKVNLPSDSCSFRVLPWGQAGILWQMRLMCIVHVCVCVSCCLKEQLPNAGYSKYVFFPSGVTPTPQHPATQNPVQLGNQQLQVWLASERDILDQRDGVSFFFFCLQATSQKLPSGMFVWYCERKVV